MAINRWISSGSEDFNLGANWTLGKPTGAQQVIFDGGSSQVDCTVGMNQSAEDFPVIKTMPTYRGSLGSPGSPLHCAAGRLEHNGSGSVYFQAATATPTNEVLLNSPNKTNALFLSGDDYDLIYAIRGRGEIAETVAGLASIFVSMRDSIDDVYLDIKAGADGIGLFAQFAGTVICGAELEGQATLHGGLLRLHTADMAAAELVAFGGRIEMNIDNDLVGNPSLKSVRLLGPSAVLDLNASPEKKSVQTVVALRRSQVRRSQDTAIHVVSERFLVEDSPQ